MKQEGLIASFASHKVAANLLMLLMILAGLLGLDRLNTQLFPTFDFDYITVTIPWRGASPEDVERAITIPVEQNLKTLANVRKFISRSQQGQARFFIEMDDGTDLSLALSDVRQRINTIRNLPNDAEEPIVSKIDRFSPVANILIYTERGNLAELRPLVRRFENELLARGIGQVQFVGLPQEEMAVQIPAANLHQLGLTLDQVAERIRAFSEDIPAGTVGRNEAAKQLRGLGQRRDEQGYAELPLFTDPQGRLLTLGDIAIIERRPRDQQPYLSYQGYPAVELQVLRAEKDDSLESAEIMQQWISDTEASLPTGVYMHTYFESWKLLSDRIETLTNNGISGLILVIGALFFFLNARIAFWVTVGIPVSFLATLGVLYFFGGTINMISLFGLILALGIIVDDAIVVGEDTLTHLQQGESPLRAATGGASRMFWPVIASSLTTIAAFLPLGMMGGAMGKIAFDIPFVMICVIIASLLECFLVLPGHLHHTFLHHHTEPGKWRQRIDKGFDDFRENRFRPFVTHAINHRYSVVTAAFCAFALAIAVIATGWLKFTFFPPVDSDQIRAVAQFYSGTDEQTVQRFLDHLEQTLLETDAELEENIVQTSVQLKRAAAGFANLGGAGSKQGDEYGTLIVEVWTGNDREISNDDFISAWREKVIMPAGLDKLTIGQPQAGPPGKPLELKLSGGSNDDLKAAAEKLKPLLAQYAGVSNVEDDLPWGKEQLTFELTAQARALGMSLTSVAAQLRSAFDGTLAQLFNEQDDEIEVRVMLPDAERNYLSALDRLPIITPSGDILPLSDVVHFDARQGVDLLRRVDNRLSVIVSADLNPEEGNANEIIGELADSILPELEARFGISVDMEGKLKEQAENLADVQTGQMLALALIYIILVWVFSSWSWPIAIMTAIMFGFTGAIIGHIFMSLFGVKFSMFSIMGLFGLSGIIVNDSIVLVTFWKQLMANGMDTFDAIVEACVRRLRAVLLTSITTVLGLLPILFETSLQAQFLKPMAVSLVFGLSFGTVLILMVVPSMLMIMEEQKPKVQSFMRHLAPTQWPQTASMLWQFDPRGYRRAHSPEAGIKGSLWWAVILIALLGIQLLASLGRLNTGRSEDPNTSIFFAYLALIICAALLALTIYSFKQHALSVRRHAQWLLWISGPLLLIASMTLPDNAYWYSASHGLWRASLWFMLGSLALVTLLRWSQRARSTFHQ